MANVKNLYRCVIKYQREVLIRRTKAFSEKQARAMIINRLAQEQGIEPYVVGNYFKEYPDGIIIEKEK